MVKNNYSSGRNEDRLLDPNGGNKEQQWAPEGTPGPHRSEMLPYNGSEGSYNMNSLLLENIRSSDYFKSLATVRSWDEFVDQVYYDVKEQYGCTPWLRGTHDSHRSIGMCSGLRGVGAAGKPTTAWILLVKALTLRPTRDQVQELLRHPDSPFIRATGFFLLRFVADPKELLNWYRPHLDDPEPIALEGSGAPPVSLGFLVRTLLRTLDFHGTRLPRLPVLVMREMAEALKPWDAEDKEAERHANEDDGADGAADESHKGGYGRGGRDYQDLDSYGAGDRHGRGRDSRGFARNSRSRSPQRGYPRDSADDSRRPPQYYPRSRSPPRGSRYQDHSQGAGEGRGGGRGEYQHRERDYDRGHRYGADGAGRDSRGGRYGGRGGDWRHDDDDSRYGRGRDGGRDRRGDAYGADRRYGGRGEDRPRSDSDRPRHGGDRGRVRDDGHGGSDRYDQMRRSWERRDASPPKASGSLPSSTNGAEGANGSVGVTAAGGESASEKLDKIRQLLGQKTGAIGPGQIGGDYASRY